MLFISTSCDCSCLKDVAVCSHIDLFMLCLSLIWLFVSGRTQPNFKDRCIDASWTSRCCSASLISSLFYCPTYVTGNNSHLRLLLVVLFKIKQHLQHLVSTWVLQRAAWPKTRRGLEAGTRPTPQNDQTSSPLTHWFLTPPLFDRPLTRTVLGSAASQRRCSTFTAGC